MGSKSQLGRESVPLIFAIDISLSDSLQESFDKLGAFLPKLVGAIVIFVIGWFVARIIRKVLHRALTRMKVDALVDRSGLGGPLETAGYPDAGLLLAKIVYWGIMLIVLQLTIDALDITAIKDVLDDLINFIPRVFVAIIIIFLVGAIANWLRGLLAGLTAEYAWGNLITNVAVGAVWLIGIFAALDQLKIAENIVQTLFTVLMGSLGLILVIKFGVGGIWIARDRFWPGVYDKFAASTRDTSTDSA